MYIKDQLNIQYSYLDQNSPSYDSDPQDERIRNSFYSTDPLVHSLEHS